MTTKPSTPTKHTPPIRGRMTVVTDDGTFTLPNSIDGLDAFRAWADDPALESVPTWFIDGDVWVDMSKEQIFTHSSLKGEITAVLYAVVKSARSGRVYPDGVLVTNRTANLSGNPDAVYVSHDTVAAGRIRLVPGAETGFTEMDGAPDMVLEVVSDSSERKDNQTLLERYWAAGIPEYWIVDARGDDLEFTIYRHAAKGYTAVRKQGGWLRSPVFGKSFRLLGGTDRQGNPEFTLEVK